MKLTSLQNQAPELHDTTYEATGQFMTQHIGAKRGSDMFEWDTAIDRARKQGVRYAT